MDQVRHRRRRRRSGQRAHADAPPGLRELSAHPRHVRAGAAGPHPRRRDPEDDFCRRHPPLDPGPGAAARGDVCGRRGVRPACDRRPGDVRPAAPALGRSPVVAVTGSSGKTSTKEMIRAALATRYRVHATTGNLNNLVGVPLTLLAAPEDAEALVVEAGASVPGEIARLRDILEPTIAVITNVGYAHVAGFGSLDGVLREKVALLERAPVAVVGTDPPELAVEARRRTRTVVAGTGAAAEVRPDAADLDDAGHPRIAWGGRSVTVPVVGFHQIENAMIALAAAREAGADPGRAVEALGSVRLPAGRGAVLERGGLTISDDTYNANPGSLHWAARFARWLSQRRGRPLAVVVGSMLELGSESARLHAAAAREIVALEPALVAAVGEFVPAFEAHRRALSGRLIAAPAAESLGPQLKAALRGDEVVLMKASRGVALERVLRHLN